MSTTDKVKNKTEEIKGRVKENVGDATGDKSMENEGRFEKVKGNVKQAGENIKDAFK